MNSNDLRSFAQTGQKVGWYPGGRPLPPEMTESRPVARFLKEYGVGLGVLSLLGLTGVGLAASAASFFALSPVFGMSSAATPMISLIPFVAGMASGFWSAIKLGSYSDATPLQKAMIGKARGCFAEAVGRDRLRQLDHDDDVFERVGPPSWMRQMRMVVCDRLTQAGVNAGDASALVEDYDLTPAEVARYDQLLQALPATDENRLTVRMIASYRAMALALQELKPVAETPRLAGKVAAPALG